MIITCGGQLSSCMHKCFHSQLINRLNAFIYFSFYFFIRCQYIDFHLDVEVHCYCACILTAGPSHNCVWVHFESKFL